MVESVPSSIENSNDLRDRRQSRLFNTLKISLNQPNKSVVSGYAYGDGLFEDQRDSMVHCEVPGSLDKRENVLCQISVEIVRRVDALHPHDDFVGRPVNSTDRTELLHCLWRVLDGLNRCLLPGKFQTGRELYTLFTALPNPLSISRNSSRIPSKTSFAS